MLPRRAAQVAQVQRDNQPCGLYRSLAILLLACITALAFLSEGALENWSTIYLRSSLDLPTVLGASGFAVFHAAMLVGRISTALGVAHFDRGIMVRVADTVAASGMVLALTTRVSLILIGFLLVGLALARVTPWSSHWLATSHQSGLVKPVR